MVRGLISFVAVSIAVVVQLTIVDRIAFPGGAGPDVVLLAVAALALAGGPMTGVLIGFWAGLALDVAPPGSHFVGQNALVFCLIGYACGLAADVPNSEGVPEQGRTALFEIVVTAAGAVLGEALAALLGAMLSDPRVSWSAIRHVLPVAIVYDVLLCPFVLYAVAAALRLAGAPRGERSRADWSMLATQSSTGASQGAIRQVNGGSTPRLRLSERGKGEGLGGGLRGPATAKREPRLKLGHGGALGAGTLGAAFANGNSRRGPGLASGTMAGALGS
ncbi:MAG TPA: rod shape-determining protein MreD, partial [Streptosporangiaceae bacterium]|nr:rod shape-determining protein MreD [Streptosporangiaceae bacterium]